MKKIFITFLFVLLFTNYTHSITRVYADNIVDPEVIETPQISSEALKSCSGSEENCYQLLEPIPGGTGLLSGVSTETGKGDQGLGGFMNFIFEIGIGVAGVLGVVMLTIYGFQYAANDKNINTFSVLRERITGVVLGLLLLLGIFIILKTINPDLLIIEPDIEKILLSLEAGAVKNEYGNPIITGGGGEYDPTGKNDVARIGRNISEYDAFFKKYSTQYKVSCDLLKGTMYRESGGDPKVVSSRGARGLMQFMPNTAKSMGFSSDDMFIPEKAIEASAKYYKDLITNGCNGKQSNSVCNTSNLLYVTAAYNGGPGANRLSSRCANQTAWQCLQAPDYKETRKYAPTVMNNILELKGRGWSCGN